jgi:hypothetical protein
MDPKKRTERDRSRHHGQERRAVNEAKRKFESWQKRETQFALSAKAIQMKLMSDVHDSTEDSPRILIEDAIVISDEFDKQQTNL